MQTEKRAELITREMQKGDVMFLKNFWNLTETTMAKHFPKILSSGLAVNLVLPVPVDMVTVAGSDRTSSFVHSNTTSSPHKLLLFFLHFRALC